MRKDRIIAGKNFYIMKHYIDRVSEYFTIQNIKKIFTLLPILFSFLFLYSCGPKSGHFRIEGRFRHLNQGEFYVYSIDGGTTGLDTIKVSDGRFVYEVPLEGKATFILLFPNFSEQAVFGESGSTAKIEGDASHLKEMEITGTDDNKDFTKFRKNANRLTPPEVVQSAATFVKEHPQSIVSSYIIRRYFLHTDQPDYQQASALLDVMKKADSQNGIVASLKKQVDALVGATQGSKLPSFAAVDTKGNSVGNMQLKAKVNIINLWATWSNDSRNIQQKIKQLKRTHGADIAALSICLDGSIQMCKQTMVADSVTWQNVCDGKMWNSPLVSRFGFGTVPANIVIDRTGTVVVRNLNSQRLAEKVESLLK